MFLKLLIFAYFASLVQSATFTATSQIYMEVKSNRKPLGRIVFALFGNDAPRAVENFRQLCLNGIDGKTYVGSRFHRVIDRFIIQGGDIVSNDGVGSVSIYGKYFDDEDLAVENGRPGFLAMANVGPNTNGCQFFITTIPYLNGTQKIFGRVIEGQGVVHKIEKTKTDTDNVPMKPIVITACGEIPTKKPFEVTDDLYSPWNWFVAAGPPFLMQMCIISVLLNFFRKLNVLC